MRADEPGSDHTPVRRPVFGVDVIAATILAIATVGLLFGPLEGWVGRAILIPLVFFLPGYALTAAAFPGAPTGSTSRSTGRIQPSPDGIDDLERVALGFGASVAMLPLVGMSLRWLGLPVNHLTVTASLAAITVAGAVVATARRATLAPADRYPVPFAKSLLPNRSSRGITDLAVNLTLAFTIVLAAVSVGYVMANPQPADGATNFYILAPDENEELVADQYPEELTADEPVTIGVGIDHGGQDPAEYTIVVLLERIDHESDHEVIEREKLEEDTVRLGPGETWTERMSLTPTMTGQNLRLTFLLFDGDPGHSPTREEARVHLHLWADVTDERVVDE